MEEKAIVYPINAVLKELWLQIDKEAFIINNWNILKPALEKAALVSETNIDDASVKAIILLVEKFLLPRV